MIWAYEHVWAQEVKKARISSYLIIIVASVPGGIIGCEIQTRLYRLYNYKTLLKTYSMNVNSEWAYALIWWVGLVRLLVMRSFVCFTVPSQQKFSEEFPVQIAADFHNTQETQNNASDRCPFQPIFDWRGSLHESGKMAKVKHSNFQTCLNEFSARTDAESHV